MKIDPIEVKQELEEAQKQDKEGDELTDEIGFENIELKALYLRHDVKEELVVGPTEVIGPNGQTIFYDTTKEQPNSPKQIFCKLCFQTFTLNVALNAHNKKCHATYYEAKSETKEGKENKIPTMDIKEKHIKNLKIKGSYTCEICRKHFALHIAYHAHKKKCHVTHPNIKKCNKNKISTKFSCNVCCKTFTLKANLIRHQNLYHCKKKLPFVCNDCSKEFIRKDYLTRHIRVCSAVLQRNKNNHSNEKRNESVNGEIYEDTSSISRHEKKNHKGLKTLNSKSEFGTSVRDKTEDHSNFVSCINSHGENLALPSQSSECVCGKIIKDQSNLARHKKKYCSVLASQIRVTCDCCNKVFTNRFFLECHKKVLGKAKSCEKLICDYCKKSYTEKRNLKDHIIELHMKLNRHKCNICNKSYSARRSLRKHQNIKH